MADLIQNSALVFILLGHFAQPAPRLAEVFGDPTWVFGISAGFVFVAGWVVSALRSRRANRPKMAALNAALKAESTTGPRPS
jgi:uncharacterized membrane protein (DUF485 family)